MRILGIEFGGYSVKAIEMESRFRKVEILDLHEVKLPIDNLDPTNNYKKATEQLLALLPSHPDKIVTSIPPAQTALRFLQVPLRQRKKIEQSYRLDLEESVPFKLEDSIIEHHVHIHKEGSLVFAAIAPKKHIQTHLEWLKLFNVDPDWLVFEGMGVINLYLSSKAAKKKQEKEKEKAEDIAQNTTPTLLMDIGHSKTNLAIIEGSQLLFFRSIPWGGLAVTQAISQGLGISLEEAEEKKVQLLRLDDEAEITDSAMEDLIASATTSFSTFLTDLSHSIVSFRAQYKKEVASAILTGGTAETKGIDSFLSEGLRIPVTFFKPFKEMDLGKEIENSQEMRFGETLGRSLVFTRKSELLFNFRQGDLAKVTSLNEVGDFLKNPSVIRVAQYIGMLAIILFVGVFFLGYLADNEAKKANEEVRKVFNDTFKTVPNKLRTTLTTNPDDLKKFINNKNKELEDKLKLASKGKQSMIGLVRQISEAFPPEVKVDVNVLSIDQKNLRLDGVLYSGTLDKVKEMLGKIPNFNNIKLELEGQRFVFRGEVLTK